MNDSFQEIEKLLIGYFSNELAESEKEKVDNWRKNSVDNEKVFQDMFNSWNAMPLLNQMESFNSFAALNKVNSRLKHFEQRKIFIYLQKAAAILIIPLMIYAGYITFKNIAIKEIAENNITMQSFTAKPGQLSNLILSDGTKIWLNSGATINFPDKFTGHKREVELDGEAYFEVAKNKEQPFLLKTSGINIEVLGTSFNVCSYKDDAASEVVLVEGKIKMFSEYDNKIHNYGYLEPGKKAVFNKTKKNVMVGNVDVDKYTSWRDGILIFRDDSMSEVVKRLSRWFNVDITISDPEIENYIYTATFSNETLPQVLYLLKVSAPINYKIVEPKVLANGELSKQKVVLTKKGK